MTLYDPLIMQADVGDSDISYSAQNERQMLDGLVAVEGVIEDAATLAGGTGALVVTQRAAGANMSVDVASGSCVILGDDVALQGKYMCVSDATENVVVPAAPGSGTRTHRIVARVKDKLHNGTYSTYEWLPDLIEDTGSGLPAEPDSAITLATVLVTAGDSSVVDSMITDARTGMRLASAASSAWQAYTPTPQVNGSNVTLGTGGSASGRYQITDGKICHVTIEVVFGSDASFPDTSNPLSVPLPIDEANTSVATVMPIHAFDGSTLLLAGIGYVGGTGTGLVDRLRFVDGSSTGDMDNSSYNVPWTAAGGSPANWRSKRLYVTGTYEIA